LSCELGSSRSETAGHSGGGRATLQTFSTPSGKLALRNDRPLWCAESGLATRKVELPLNALVSSTEEREEEVIVMVRLELTPEQAGVLREVLESLVSEMRMEIVSTEQMDFREALKERKEFLNQLIRQLQTQPVDR
jgi:hypothetical protein